MPDYSCGRVTHTACISADKSLYINELSTRNYSAEISPRVSHISLMGAHQITLCHSGWQKHIGETPHPPQPCVIASVFIANVSSRWSPAVLPLCDVNVLPSWALKCCDSWNPRTWKLRLLKAFYCHLKMHFPGCFYWKCKPVLMHHFKAIYVEIKKKKNTLKLAFDILLLL